MSGWSKKDILDDLFESAKEELLDYEDELRGLARGLAIRLVKLGTTTDDEIATDARVIKWCHSIPLDDGFATSGLFYLVKEAVYELNQQGLDALPRANLRKIRVDAERPRIGRVGYEDPSGEGDSGVRLQLRQGDRGVGRGGAQ